MGIPTRECFEADHPAEAHHHERTLGQDVIPHYRHRHPACPWDCGDKTYVQTTAGDGRRAPAPKD